MNHTQIGDITEYRFALYCMEHNIAISKPMNNNLPYDFIIEINRKLLKLQVKTGYDAPGLDCFMLILVLHLKIIMKIQQKIM